MAASMIGWSRTRCAIPRPAAAVLPMADIYRSIMPFLLAMIVLLGILMLVPETALYLPRTMR
jgi:TRAP-type C4-dicarboxylate transport system permease large subunit